MYALVDEELANEDECRGRDTTGMRELGAHLYRLQKLMLSLLTKFQPQPLASQSNLPNSDSNQQHFSCVQIATNVMLYARNQVNSEQKIFNKLIKIESASQYILIFCLFPDAT